MKNQKNIVGAELMLKNALGLRSSAEALAHESKYGYATSLLILAAEEALKAVVYYSAGVGIALDPDGVNKYQKSHRKRHRLTSALLVMSYYVEKSRLAVGDEIGVERKIVEILKLLFADVQNGEIPDRVSEVIEWWKCANQLKQKGMYVDEESDGWSAPSQFSQDTYDEVYESVRPIIDGARFIRLIERCGYTVELKRLFDIDYDALGSELAIEFQLKNDISGF